MQHRLAFPLVAREGDWSIRFGGDNTAGGSGLPKRPHVHVYRGQRTVAAFWLWPKLEEKERSSKATPAEVAKARRLVVKYLTEALAAWRKYFKDSSKEFTGAVRQIDFHCETQPRVIALHPDFFVVRYCGKAVVLRIDHIPGFAEATPRQLRYVVAPDPDFPWLHWPDLDGDIFLEDLFC
jgi:hypothetical protein